MTRFRLAQLDLTLVVGNSTKVVCPQALTLRGAGDLGAIVNTDMEKRKLKLFSPQEHELLLRTMHPPGFEPGNKCEFCANPMRTPCRGIRSTRVLYAQALDGTAEMHLSFCMRPHHVSCHPMAQEEEGPPVPTAVGHLHDHRVCELCTAQCATWAPSGWAPGDGPIIHGSNGMGDLN